jgi:hypothetical protein
MRSLKIALAMSAATLGMAFNSQAAAQQLEVGLDVTGFALNAKGGAGSGPVDMFFDTGNVADVRPWLKWGMVRVRGFQFDESEFYSGADHDASIRMIDLEIVDDFAAGNFNIELSGGVRWGSIDLDGNDVGSVMPSSFDGLGITAAVEVERQFGASPFGVYFGGRYFVMYGETDAGIVPDIDNTFVDGTEISFGLQWQINDRFRVRGGYEQQVYGTDNYFPSDIDPETIGDVSLGGFVIGGSMTY